MGKQGMGFWQLRIIVLLLLCCLGIVGCGKKEEQEEIKDIWKETEQVSYGADEVNTSDMLSYDYLGSQYWQGERIQIWGERRTEGCDVYLHREDGSRELLAEGVNRMTMTPNWWIDNEKNNFIYKGTSGIVRIGSDGKEIFNNNRTEGSVNGICQLEDGRYVILQYADGGYKLEELDSDSGSLEEFRDVQLNSVNGINMITAEGNGVLLLAQDGIWDVNLTDGVIKCRISFKGTSYALTLDESERRRKDFRVFEDGEAEVLWSDGTVEYLKSGQVDEEKQVLTFRIPYPTDWVKEQVIKFNQTSTNYYVSIQEDTDYEYLTYAERTALDIGVGKGADIICSDAVYDVYSLLEKGAFEDLTPYMEAADIREEDYFPAAFTAWKYDGKVYGVNYTAKVGSVCVNEAIAGGEGLFSAGDLVERLLAYDGDALLFQYSDALDTLDYLLSYSESLCGTVDLADGTCDFHGEIFEKLLEAAKRYGKEDSRSEWEALAERKPYYSFYFFNDNDYFKQHGKVPAGYPFDEGGCTLMEDNLLAINTNSPNKEGAWEFICYMLGDDVQSDFHTDEAYPARGKGVFDGSFPVSRSAFEKLCESHLEVFEDGKHVTVNGKEVIIKELTEERKEELRTALEEARPAPLQTRPLIQIILEEAEAYFSGTKTIEEVRAMVENRVQLYLNERK